MKNWIAHLVNQGKEYKYIKIKLESGMGISDMKNKEIETDFIYRKTSNTEEEFDTSIYENMDSSPRYALICNYPLLIFNLVIINKT